MSEGIGMAWFDVNVLNRFIYATILKYKFISYYCHLTQLHSLDSGNSLTQTQNTTSSLELITIKLSR